MIFALHLLIIQTTIWVFVLSDTFLNPLWVTVVKTILFKGLLYINAAKKFGGMH